MTEEEFFNWLREHQDNGRLTQDMVDGANEVLALIGTTKLMLALEKINGWKDEDKTKQMKLSKSGSDFIKQYEKFVAHPYRDAVGVWTIGYGNTYYENRKSVSMSDKPITEKRASELKQNIINMDFAPAVNLLFADEIAEGKITQNMFDALVSLAYNIGTRGLAGSSVVRYIKAGDYKKAGDSFLLWNKGRVRGDLVELKGLTRRRKDERAMFLAA
ncbi:lysozyme [Psychrobacter sp. I-STPA10]|uniref:lysozyme n=1 Tax=Psychrobacter sp. I-STPA10 TaxID=2585769 RepID=UPI001E579E26|nr:lysozyme [Psychrobacter sp. I-STPA10]